MANSDFLRNNITQHKVKNSLSKHMDTDIEKALHLVVEILNKKYPNLSFKHQKTLPLSEAIKLISNDFPAYKNSFSQVLASSFIRPDGGFLFASDGSGKERIILVSEVKHQGTNDKRKEEGLPVQAMGNAIERLGKNLIGVRALFKKEQIIPFICFGCGNDFSPGSSILDRVITMNDFFPLNKLFIKKDFTPFEPVSMHFRYEDWTIDEMVEKMLEVAETAVSYYFS